MEVSYKTVFVLDHSPYFAAKCGQPLDVEALKIKDRKISKSLWTCCVEVALEYRRIICDLFQRNTKFIRFVLSDSIGRFVTPDWGEDSNRLENVLLNLSQAGPPDPSVEEINCSIINGLSLAVEALIQSTKIQIEQKKKGMRVDENCGRIVVVTHLKNNDDMVNIHNHMVDLIDGQNKLANNLGDSFLALNKVELCLVNIGNDVKSNSGNEFWKNENKKTMISTILKSEFIDLSDGASLNSAFHLLVQRHFNLASTTISGIPMKEEQCASSQSTNYDVELLHPREVHKNLAMWLCDNTTKQKLLTSKNGYETLLLKWNSPAPKTGLTSQFVSCGACPVTPVEVNSRPSACLTGFVLTGRTVLLELPNKANKDGTKCISHILTNHDGRIHMQSLHLSKSALDEMPSISEYPGGKVFDYRIAQFGEIVKEFTLDLDRKRVSEDCVDLKNALSNLETVTSYFPLLLSESVIFCSPTRFEYLINTLKKRTLTDADISECKKIIVALNNSELKNEPIAPSSQIIRIKGLKRDEQYAIIWKELESYVKNYAHYSQKHLDILMCVRQCIGKGAEPSNVDDFSGISVKPGKRPAVPKSSDSKSEKTTVAEAPPAKRGKFTSEIFPTPSKSLLAIWSTMQQNYYWAGWKNFYGRTNNNDGSNKVELYKDLMQKMLLNDGKKEDVAEKSKK